MTQQYGGIASGKVVGNWDQMKVVENDEKSYRNVLEVL